MSCELKIRGIELDPDHLLRETGLHPRAIIRRGTEWAKVTPHGWGIQKDSAVIVRIAEGLDFEDQKAAAIEFLAEHKRILAGLTEFPGVESIEINFDVEYYTHLQIFILPPQLMRIVGELSFTVHLNTFPADEIGL